MKKILLVVVLVSILISTTVSASDIVGFSLKDGIITIHGGEGLRAICLIGMKPLDMAKPISIDDINVMIALSKSQEYKLTKTSKISTTSAGLHTIIILSGDKIISLKQIQIVTPAKPGILKRSFTITWEVKG